MVEQAGEKRIVLIYSKYLNWQMDPEQVKNAGELGPRRAQTTKKSRFMS